MDHDTLDSVTNLIKGDPVFKKGRQCPKQMVDKHQLMISMHFIWEKRRKYKPAEFVQC
jgi:hypothetical protein